MGVMKLPIWGDFNGNANHSDGFRGTRGGNVGNKLIVPKLMRIVEMDRGLLLFQVNIKLAPLMF